MKKTKALIPESPILVLPSLARQIGLNEAIILQQMHYWLLDSKHIHDDKPWIYNSYVSWQRTNFPFWSINTIKRTILNLEKAKIIQSGNFNKLKIDRTKWYTINYENIPDIHPPLAQNEPIRIPKRANQDTNMSPPLPETTTETTTKNKEKDETLKDKVSTLPTNPKEQRKPKFIKPTLEDVQTYIASKKLVQRVDAEQFWHFYESKDWMVGKNKMKNWHSAVATWAKRSDVGKNTFVDPYAEHGEW